MAFSKNISSLTSVFIIIFTLFSPSSSSLLSLNPKLFREYIGAMGTGVKFSDVPVDPNVEIHFILSFAIDYTTSSSPLPTDGNFNIFWDTENLTSSRVAAIKQAHPNIKVALSLGGDTVSGQSAYFKATSIDTWVTNAVSSLTKIIKEYNLDGIDIDYEHFRAIPQTFAECIGRLLTILKSNGVVSFTSIAPYDNRHVQKHYLALWRRYEHVIDYVNFQFYAYSNTTNVSQFLTYFEEQRSSYKGGKVLASFSTDLGGGLSPENGFFQACQYLKMQGKLQGIFVWSADTSLSNGFYYEKVAQSLLAK